MSALYPKNDLIEIILEFFKHHLIDEDISREDLDVSIEGIDENGRVIYSRKTNKNVVLDTILISVVVGVVSALITEAIKAGAKNIYEHYQNKEPEMIQKEIGAPDQGQEGKVALQVIVFIQQKNPSLEIPPSSKFNDEEP